MNQNSAFASAPLPNGKLGSPKVNHNSLRPPPLRYPSFPSDRNGSARARPCSS